MLPHEKTLVQRLKDEPFALIGINSDGDAEKVKKILSEQGINWRQAIDDSTSGPWATKWGVQGWPTIYVLDHKGVIRFKDVRDADMDKAVDQLLEELRAEQQSGSKSGGKSGGKPADKPTPKSKDGKPVKG